MKGADVYTLLLLLYPKRFRIRFSTEMLRLYQDCCPASGGKGYWFELLKDLVVSVPREWRHQLGRGYNRYTPDYTGILDTAVCSLIVGTLLLSWGLIGATYALEAGLQTGSILWSGSHKDILFPVVALATAMLVGTLGRYAASRGGRIETLCSQPGNSGKFTAL
jgi:hypothetical protein